MRKNLINRKFLSGVMKMETDMLLTFLLEHLESVYNYQPSDIFTDYDNYAVFKGDIPIGLVAHVDTVLKAPPKEIIYDSVKEVMWSTSGGLGADDRAGVVAILELLRRGYKPTVIFCNYEEIGCLGATALSKEEFLEDIKLKYLIEIDRRGSLDCVFYQDDNEEFHEYVETFGFVTAYGSVTDICKLSPVMGISGVNLSTGYYNEHTATEFLRLDELKATVDKVENMLIEGDTVQKFKFKQKEYASYNYGGYVYGGANYGGTNYFEDYYFNPVHTKAMEGNGYIESDLDHETATLIAIEMLEKTGNGTTMVGEVSPMSESGRGYYELVRKTEEDKGVDSND